MRNGRDLPLMLGSPYKTSDRTITGTITPVGHAPYRNRGRNRRRGFLHDRGEPPGSAALAALKWRVASGEWRVNFVWRGSPDPAVRLTAGSVGGAGMVNVVPSYLT